MLRKTNTSLQNGDRWRWPPQNSVCVRAKSISVYVLLLGLLLSSITASSAGLERPKYRTAYACEGSTLNMDCDRDHVINLIRANYGRFSITICNEHGNTEWSVNCMSLRSHRVLHDRCSQRQNCSVPASTRGFGDPCPGTLKYLEAHFQCVPVNPPSHTTRPRPPWFLATKTTPSSIAEDRIAEGAPFPRDPPLGGGAGSIAAAAAFPEDGENGGGGGGGGSNGGSGVGSGGGVGNGSGGAGSMGPPQPSSTSTTTTLRPPPWLITNATAPPSSPSSPSPSSASPSPTTPSTTSTTTTSASSTTTPRSVSSSTQHSSSTVAGAGSPPKGALSPSSVTTPSPDADPEADVHQDLNKGPVTSSTVSSTTLWSPQAEIPRRGSESDDGTSSWCPPSSGRELFWNWTRGGEVAVQPCPGGASGWATRQCALRGGWISPPDLGECRSVWLSSLLTRTESEAESKDGALAVAQDLTKVTRSRKLYGGDVTAAARLVSELTRRMGDDLRNFPDGAQREALVTELVEEALKTVSNLIVWQRLAWGDLRRPSEHNAALTQLLLGLEETAFFLSDNIHHEKTINYAASNVLMRLQVLETRNVARVTFPTVDDPWPYQTVPTPHYPSNPYMEDMESFPPSSEVPSTVSSSQNHLQDFITLPPEALLENSENGLVKMVFFSYKGLEKLLEPERGYRFVDGSFQSPNSSRVLNSRVLSASLGAGRHIELSEPVYITFAMIRTTNVSNPACVFWDYTTSSWSEEGCRVLIYNVTHATCQCDHLTNFAVLMDVHASPISPQHQVALSVITYVGCVISIVGLLLATVVFHAFKGLKSDRTTIHKNLCICLLVGEALFVGGIARTDHPLVCSIIAGFLHYFFLAAFAWMFLEGFQLYIMLVEVFEAEKSRVRWYYITAYGFPAIVVAVSAVIDPYSYGTSTVCWLRTDNYFIFAFVGPVLLVLLANSVFLALSLVLMCRHAHNSAVLKNKETSRLASLRSWIRGAVILMFLLGLTWTFGLLYLDQASVAMAYVFTVLNSLQGLFIFVFHCLQNDKLISGFSSGRWRRRSSAGSVGACPPHVGTLREGTVTDGAIGSLRGRGSLIRASHTSTGSRVSRHAHSSLRHAHQPNLDHEDEKYSFKSCGRDSGHGGSEQEESPRTGAPTKLSSLRLNNNVTPHQNNERPHLGVNPFAAAATLEHPNPSNPSALLPDYRMPASEVPGLRYPSSSLPGGRLVHRNQSPWNHTYTEIQDGVVVRPMEASGPDPVYEEIEREGRSEIQVSDMSDEDGRRQSSDISRQSSRSYGDHRPLLPYTLPDRNCPPTFQNNDPRFQARFRHNEQVQVGLPDNQSHYPNNRIQAPIDHTIVSAGHILPLTHPTVNGSHALPPGNGHIGPPVDIQQYQEAMMAALGHNTVVQPLSEPNLRSWEAVQRHRDLQQLQHLGEMTVAVLNGEQVVCKLKSPLAPIHENSSSQATTVATATVGAAGSGNGERFIAAPQTFSHC